MDELIISVSGLRGIVGQSLTPEVAGRFASAFSHCLPPGQVVVTRDGRASGPLLAASIADALTGRGREVVSAGVAATPTTGVLVRRLNCVGGIQISASHNPAEYNGIKLFNADGRVIPADEGERVRAAFLEGRVEEPTSTSPGKTIELVDSTSAHLDLICGAVDVGRIRAKSFPVLLDSNHGAGALLGRRLLESLGCRVTVLGETPDGAFDHTPEPTAENLTGVAQQARESGAAVAFCQDPDADRLALIDENGRYVGEEYTLAVCVNHVLSQSPGPVVTNCSTSRMTQDIAARHGVPFHHSAVGEANVVDKMLLAGAVIGGEGNGGVIDPRIVYVRDSFISMALVLEAMATRGLPLGALVDELPRYAIHKAKVAVPRDRIPAALAALEQHFTTAQANHADGLRLDWPDGRWLLMRASNTEPIVRLFCEASTEIDAASTVREAEAVMQPVC
ncbi:MAG: phosphoglucosamine mutase [Planctomycetales bacterium]|nr:phosphoglucosamine mutase [Planctomycetales bacterium]